MREAALEHLVPLLCGEVSFAPDLQVVVYEGFGETALDCFGFPVGEFGGDFFVGVGALDYRPEGRVDVVDGFEFGG